VIEMAEDGIPSAYNQSLGGVNPDWLNKGDNAWQLTAATLVGMQTVPALVILYGSIVKKKWAVNSAFMAFYAFAAVLLCWVGWAYKMSFGEKLIPIWGKAGTTLSYKYLLAQATLPASATADVGAVTPFFPMATQVYFQFVFAAITLVLLAGSVLGRMSFRAWMLFASSGSGASSTGPAAMSSTSPPASPASLPPTGYMPNPCPYPHRLPTSMHHLFKKKQTAKVVGNACWFVMYVGFCRLFAYPHRLHYFQLETSMHHLLKKKQTAKVVGNACWFVMYVGFCRLFTYPHRLHYFQLETSMHHLLK
jgi:hypothetical protein